MELLFCSRKRNEREAVETPGDVIVRKLTIERIEELKKLIAKEAEEYRWLKIYWKIDVGNVVRVFVS